MHSHDVTPGATPARPLAGVRVLELGQLVAGPFAGSMLGYFGAEVIKVEPPGKGDPLRVWRILDRGTSLWWRSMGRNKKCITLNLHTEKGRQLARQLADRVDVLLENFRPGTMEKWSLGPEDLKATNPGLIYARVSGYGQTGPYATRPGFASVCEGVGEFRYLNGFPGGPPVRPNLSMAVPAGPIYSVADMLRDPHFHARGLFEDVEVDGKPLQIPAIAPRLSATPGGTDCPGPAGGCPQPRDLGWAARVVGCRARRPPQRGDYLAHRRMSGGNVDKRP